MEGLLPSSRMGSIQVPVAGRRSCLYGLLEPMGDGSAGGQFSEREAWIFCRRESLPSATKKHWQLW